MYSKRPIRILQMIGSLNIGGSQALVMNLYRCINRDIIQFDFIIDHPAEQFYAEEIKRMGGRIFVMPSFKGTNYIEVSRVWNTFFDEHPEYSVIHSHVRSYASIYLRIAKKHGLSTIIHSHNTSNGTGISALGKQVLQYPLRYIADYYFGCSKEAAQWLFGKKIIYNKNYYMLKNGVPVDKYEFDMDVRKAIRKKYSIDSDILVVGTVGRFEEQKNPEFIVDIAKCIKKSSLHNNIKLLWVGDGSLKKGIEEKCRKNGLSDIVIFTGPRKDVNRLLQAMDVFILPSLFEGLPVVSVEAQAAGLPTLLSSTITRDVEISDLVEYISIDDAQEWLKAIIRVSHNRHNVSEDICNSGFDINASVVFLTAFYEKISKENNIV